MAKKRITLEQIAKEIHISRVTISKVINGHESVSQKNRQIVLDALNRYGYKQNRAARSLVQNRSYTIGIICFDSPRSPYFMKNILGGVKEAEQQFRDYGLELDIVVTPITKPVKQLEALQKMQCPDYDALAVIPNDIYSPQITREIRTELFKAAETMPVITFNRYLSDASTIPYIGSDYVQSGRMAAEFMAKIMGRGSIIIGVPMVYSHFVDVKDRVDGIMEQIEKYPHITFDSFYYYHGNHDNYITYIKEKHKGDSPLGLIDVSYQLQHIARTINDGKDHIPIVGFDQYTGYDDDLLQEHVDAIISQDMYAQGYQTINYLFKFLTGEISEIPPVHIKNEILISSNA